MGFASHHNLKNNEQYMKIGRWRDKETNGHLTTIARRCCPKASDKSFNYQKLVWVLLSFQTSVFPLCYCLPKSFGFVFISAHHTASSHIYEG